MLKSKSKQELLNRKSSIKTVLFSPTYGNPSMISEKDKEEYNNFVKELNEINEELVRRQSSEYSE